MILGINGIRLVGKRSGVGRAIEAFLHYMEVLDHPFTEVRVYSPEPIDPAVRLPSLAKNVILPSRLPPGLWEQITLPAAHGSQHVLFCPSYVSPIFARCPVVLAHHGSYEGYKDAQEVFSTWALLKARISYTLSAHLATRVSTVSDYSRRDMVRYYRLPAHRIEVIPEGVDTSLFRPIDDFARLSAWRTGKLGEDTPFLLYVGKPTKRRNLPNLLRAFACLKQQHRLPHKLMLIGTALPGVSFDPLIAELGIADSVIKIDYAQHDEIAIAYNACDVFLYPSSYEGFGMPVLEAMACGAAVITLDNTAFPEFAGGVARLLPDAEVDTIARAILDLHADSTERARMAKEGPIRAAQYDWRIITQSYLNLITSVLPSK